MWASLPQWLIHSLAAMSNNLHMWKYDVIHKREICNVSLHRHRRTEPRLQVTCTKNLVKIGRVVPKTRSTHHFHHPSPLHSFTPGLKLSFSANPSHHSLPFLLLDWLHGFPGLFTNTSEQGCGTGPGTGGTIRLRSEPEPEPLKNHRFRFWNHWWNAEIRSREIKCKS